MNDTDIAAQMTTLSHNQRERLAYLEFCLYFLGEFRRIDLMSRFAVAPAVATRDIAQYKIFAESNLYLHQPSKSYRISSQFKPIFEHKLEQVMSALLQGDRYGIEGLGHSLLPCEYPTLLNRPQLPILAATTRAIRAEKLLQIRYHSASSGEQERVIAPFAIIDSGLRWHVRAYDRLRKCFIDLVLTRILSADVLDEYPRENETPSNDDEWNREIELELVPHPSQADPLVAILDYGMQDGMLRLKVRAATAGYMLRRWFVDCSPSHTLHDKACRLWLSNFAVLNGVESRLLAPGYIESESSQ